MQAIFRQSFSRYAGARCLPLHLHKAAQAITTCRTAALGGHVQACPAGHVERIWYNSCKHRSCPQCAFLSTERWLAAHKERLLACDHYHVVFTIPRELHELWRYNRRVLANLLFASVRDTLFTLLADPKHLGATPGVIAALHTWGRTLSLHPHLHCLVTGGGWTEDGAWKAVRGGFLLPVRVVMPVFRGKLLDALRQQLRRGALRLPEGVWPQQVENALNRLGRKPWNVRLQERYAHGQGVLTYLARYLKGGPIANRRLVRRDAAGVTFRYTDHRDGRNKPMTLSAEHFLHRVLQHIPEPGTHGVRSYGLYATAKRAWLAQCRESLGQPPIEPPAFLDWQSAWQGSDANDPSRCSVCGQPIICAATVPRRRPPPVEVGYAQAA